MARALGLMCGAALVTAGACSLASLDGLTGAGGVDGGLDSGFAADAGPDDAATGDATDGAPFCDLTRDAAFCDDFERQNPVFGWDSEFLDSDASMTITQAPGAGSSVLHVVVPAHASADAAAGYGTACLTKVFPRARRARVSFDAFVETAGATTWGALVQVYTANDAGTTTEQLKIGGGATTLEEGLYPASQVYSHVLKRNLKIGAWERVTVALTTDTSPPTISVSFGDEVVLPETTAHALPGTVGIYLPLAALLTPPDAWSIYVDNVLVELTP